MLTSLLSLYIAAIIHIPISINTENFSSENSIARIASLDFETMNGGKSIPIKDPHFISPIINANASISTDLATGEILYEKNSHERLPIASITKLMTILITLEENKLNEVVKISNNAANTEGTKMFLRAGEEIAVENLLYGAIIGSANDAAVALAEHNAETVEAFVEKMNEKAKTLGLINTHFSNPIGLDSSNNYSSAYDLTILAKYVYNYQFVKDAAKLKQINVKSVTGDYTHKLESTNDLLDNKYFKIKGLKTGTTDMAGLCLVAIAENDNGNEILTILLNSPNRFKETKILVDWIFRAYTW